MSGSRVMREVLREVLLPAFDAAIAGLDGPAVDDRPEPAARARIAETLASAAERAQHRLGEDARDPAAHRAVGAAAAAAMALSFGDASAVAAADVRAHLLRARELVKAGSWSPEDQDPA